MKMSREMAKWLVILAAVVAANRVPSVGLLVGPGSA
jgi:hypothetical protein